MEQKRITLYLKKHPTNKRKKKFEFMQIVVLITLFLSFLWVTLSYVLAFLEKPDTLENLSGSVASVTIVAILGYSGTNCVRASSYNKYRRKDGDEHGDDTTAERISGEDYPVSESRYEED